jgi:hypothetical protein
VYIYVQDLLTQTKIKNISINIIMLDDVNKIRIVVTTGDKILYDKKADLPVPFLPWGFYNPKYKFMPDQPSPIGELLSEQDVGIGSEGSQPTKQMFHIFHAYNPLFQFTEKEKQPRKYVGYVLADNLNDAVNQAQNSNVHYSTYNQRDTTVGDLIQDHYGFYMICSVGLKLVCLVDDEGGE